MATAKTVATLLQSLIIASLSCSTVATRAKRNPKIVALYNSRYRTLSVNIMAKIVALLLQSSVQTVSNRNPIIVTLYSRRRKVLSQLIVYSYTVLSAVYGIYHSTRQ